MHTAENFFCSDHAAQFQLDASTGFVELTEDEARQTQGKGDLSGLAGASELQDFIMGDLLLLLQDFLFYSAIAGNFSF